MSKALWAGLLAGAAVMAGIPSEARACGGCFLQSSETPTVVNAHRMAISISTARSILWDQISYAGNPAEFAWVLPVQPGTNVELSTDAFFEVLESSTQANVTAPAITCGGSGGSGLFLPFACSADALSQENLSGSATGADNVTVVHQGTVGPYETFTLRATEPNALPLWLAEHNFNVEPDFTPVINAYVAEGFDFIALRLLPSAGIQQMKPVRVVFPGPIFTFPLRMVAAGVGAEVGVTLFVLGEGRWEAANGANVAINPTDLEWDFTQSRSNYTQVRETLLAQNEGKTWLTPYARQGSLLAPVQDNVNGFTGQVSYTSTNFDQAFTIARAYANQGRANGETQRTDCATALENLASSTQVVEDVCDTCVATSGMVDNRTLKCGALDDLAEALVGMHPASVWLTRLEAVMPKHALTADLFLGASAVQVEKRANIIARNAKNIPSGCTLNAPVAVAPPAPGRGRPEELASLFTVFGPMVLGMMLVRRSVRRRR